MTRLLTCVLSALCVQGMLPSMAHSEVLEWTLRNEHKDVVFVKFFSRNRDHQWPDAGLVFALRDDQNHTQSLTCRRGEQMCFGGFNGDRSLTWGVGENGGAACSSCCRVCGETYRDVDVLK